MKIEMAVSDDEVEDVPEFVTNYYFEDDKAEPISFSVLPVCWNVNEAVPDTGKQIYVRGRSDDGLHNLYKPVKAWKFDLSGKKAVISVLLNDNGWIKLQKPRNSYEGFVRTVLITVTFLHLVKWNTELHGKFLWDKLSKVFSLVEEKPSQYDLVDHMALIKRAVECDASLRKSKYLMALLEKKIHKKNRDSENGTNKGIKDFIVDDDTIVEPEENGSVEAEGDQAGVEDSDGDEEDDNGDCCDSVCFICDEGGSLLCCEGSCLRSFHASWSAAADAGSGCRSLGLSDREVRAIEHFKCQNCELKVHQCYSCGQLGSSDKDSVAEVFQCVNATCGYFYHPHCVATRLHCDNEDAAKELQKNISAGEPFTCPLHVCFVCGQPENNSDPELQMAVCRRCPKAYHRKCLPREIPFEDDEEDEDIVQRAWDNLLVDRILIYCLDHVILEDLGTPSRDHIKFPGDEKVRNEANTLKLKKNKAVLKSEKSLFKKKLSQQGSAREPGNKTHWNDHANKTDSRFFKPKGTEISRGLSAVKKTVYKKVERKIPEELELSCKSDKLHIVDPSKIMRSVGNELVQEVDSNSKTRILNIIKEASTEITLDDVIKKQDICSHAYKQKMDICKSINPGKVEGFCKAIQAAMSKIDAGGSVEEAKNICQPKILDQVAKWKSKLRVSLAPFLHGMRYTSFGRHFTKVDKLNEIVDTMHWYVNNNDTIVDFCCGANDFSWLLKQKLESMGKTCHYRNYDLFPPKNDFSFEKRDWMSVQPKELPNGSQLIMGLNPPFGVKGGLANQFINKALQFKPKLLILIVPLETERLDKKKAPYDLVWEDRNKLSGRSFYLPGSVDVNDKQMEDWNVTAPVLYLWSRPDWTARHKAIAKEHDHPHGRETDMCNQNVSNRDSSLKILETTEKKKADDVSALADGPERLKERAAGEKQPSVKDHSRGKRPSPVLKSSKADGESQKKRHSEEMHVKKKVELSREQKRRRSSPLNTHNGQPRQSPVSKNDEIFSHPSRYEQTPTNVGIGIPGQGQFESARYGNGRYSSEGQPFKHQESPSDLVTVRDHHHDQFQQHTTYQGRDGRFETPDGYCNDKAGNYHPHDMHPGVRFSGDGGHPSNYLSRVSPPPPAYHPHFPGVWESGYVGEAGRYGVNPLYSEPEPRFRATVFPPEPSYRTDMSATDKYNLRLDGSNHARMSGYEPDLGPPAGVGSYNHLDPRQGYPGAPTGFASRPFHNFRHQNGSSGGWIND